MVRLTDRPDMTLDVYRGGKTTAQQQQQALLKGIALAIVARSGTEAYCLPRSAHHDFISLFLDF